MSNSPTPPIDMNHIVIDSNRIAFRYQTAATAQSADTPPVIPAALDDVTLTIPMANSWCSAARAAAARPRSPGCSTD